ncbi:MAG: hypothetical protein IJ272_03715 [Clostridia bacterium]|nr:hypothetical protein [Clostridia bacterium]
MNSVMVLFMIFHISLLATLTERSNSKTVNVIKIIIYSIGALYEAVVAIYLQNTDSIICLLVLGASAVCMIEPILALFATRKIKTEKSRMSITQTAEEIIV